MKHYYVLCLAYGLFSLSAAADNAEEAVTTSEGVETPALTVSPETPAVGTDAPEPAGFLTGMLNSSIEKAMPQADPAEKPVFSRTTTGWASAPKFGGYVIGKYDYTSYSEQSGQPAPGTNSFSARLIRVYVDGSIFKDFKYRLQVELQGGTPGPHVKDFYVSWSHWKELEIKVGQFKRAFTFENPYNPWDVGVGDYSQLVKKLAGFSDYIGNEAGNTGGRDIGVQVAGDAFPVGQDQHRLLHYQLGVYNGQGINNTDANNQKDVIGTLQVQPIKDLYVGFFGWTGNATYSGVTVRRERYAVGAKYEHNGWSARAEYAHHSGTAGSRADAWYATVGVPCTPWLKVYGKYDVFRKQASWRGATSIYSICPNFQIHKNLMLQLQYNFVNDRTKTSHHNYSQLWVETYVRF